MLELKLSPQPVKLSEVRQLQVNLLLTNVSKRAVVLANGRMLDQGEYLLLADSRGVDEAAAMLMPPIGPITAGFRARPE